MPDSSTPQQAVAIIGAACRFPGARSLDELWRNLRDGRESITFFSRDELRGSGIDEARSSDPAYVPAKGYLEDAELFDAGYFGFTPREAEITDPQQRLFLEVAVEALESAGCDPRRFPGAIGVFGGVSVSTYLLFNLLPNRDLMSLVGSTQASTRNRTDHLTTRVAYALDLRGPAVTVQTACSTSLVAVHLACNALLQGECDVALAGGASVSSPRKSGYLHQEGGILSPDGHCRAFDARAAGTLAGEGAGIVVLKPLAAALEDGDPVHAVILGSAINNDGSLKVGYTAPSVDGQALAIAEAQAVAGVEPESVGYIEAHGTATPLGDPIEIEALTRVFRRRTAARGFCGVGSIKSNLGHLDAAAGIAGLLKAVLALRHREMPPTLHVERPSPSIPWHESPFFVNDRLRPWRPGNGAPLRVGVSSFGIGGTNCHLVLEEAPRADASGPSREWQVILLSTRSAPSLEAATERLASDLDGREVPLADVASTLALGRTQHLHRRALVCRSVPECVEALTSLDPGRVFAGVADEAARGTVFLFPGQGAQHTGMAEELYRREPTFREALDRCFGVLADLLGEDPEAVLWDPDEADLLGETRWAQCALFAVEWSLARLWASWGVEPAAMIGHSIGEYVAACLAGVLEVEAALGLVAERGRLMQRCPEGAMLMVPLSEQDARRWIERLDPGAGALALAAVNGPSLCVVSGTREAIDGLAAELAAAGVAGTRRLHVSHAFHSPLMEPALEEFGRAVAGVPLRPPTRPWASNVTGRMITAEEAVDPGYWVRHLRETVRFSDGLSAVLAGSNHTLLEVGPGRSLRTLARWHPDKSPGQVVLSSLPPADSGEPQERWLRETLARLWVTGVAVDFDAYYRGERRRRVELPTYPFERRRYWVEAIGPETSADRAAAGRRPFDRWFHVPAWRRAPLPVAAEAGASSARWLIFADDLGFAPRLAARIRERGEPVTVRSLGDDRPGETVGSGAAELGELLDELAAAGGAPDRIVHLATLGAAPDGAEGAAELQRRGFYSLLHLGQALGAQDAAGEVHLLVVTDGVCEITGDEALVPERATVLGPARVIPQELPRVHGRTVDLALPAPASEEGWERLVDQVLAEALSADSERAVAYRGDRRWVERYQEVALPPAPERSPAVRTDGAYLIAGGLGGIGLEIAGWLTRQGASRLALLGRSGLPPRERWSELLARESGGAVARRVRRVLELEESAEVMVLTADLADPAATAAAVERVRERFGRIDGVVHAAGVAGGGVIQLKTDQAAAAVLAAKVEGTRALHRALAGAPLDFFVLCSARGSILGGFGQVDYCAANAFLDAFAHRLARDGRVHAMAIDWPAWREVGMLFDAAERQKRGSGADEAGEPAGHRLLDRRLAAGDGADGREDFFTRFSPATHWVLDEHRIIRSPVIPGTAYLEMARAAVERRAPDRGIELREVFFLAPLVVRDDQQREVRTRVERAGDGFRFRISSQGADGAGAESAWRDFAVGTAHPLPPDEAPVHDLKKWIDRCGERSIVLTDEDRTLEDLGPRWQSLREVHVGDRELVARFELPAEFAGDLGDYQLHPALLDRVNGTAKEYLAGRGFYLPMSYRRLTIRAPLPKRIWAHSRFKSGGEDDRGETITFDVVITDESGRELVAIDDFSQKRVNDVAGQMKALGGEERRNDERHGGEGESVYDRALRAGIAPAEGTAAFARALAARGLHQIVVSPADLAEELAAQSRPQLQEQVVEEVESLQRGERPLHERPDLSTDYAEPSNEVERSMVEIWQSLLGVAPVGVGDNFFELGGDSVQAIQLVTRYRQAGLEVSPQQLFQHQTIAELAAAVADGSGAGGAGDEAEGLAPTPVQRLLLAGNEPASAIVARCRPREGVAPETLARALDTVARHHSSLRLRLVETAGGWRQQWPASEPPTVAEVELADDVADDVGAAGVGAELAAGLDARTGPVLAAALVTRRGSAPELLVAVHEAAADGASLAVLLDDLTTVHRQIASGEEPRLSHRSARVGEWLEAVRGRAGELDPETVPGPAEGPGAATALPADGPDPEPGGPGVVETTLGEDETAALSAVAGEQRVSLDEVLLASLAAALERRFGGAPPAIEVERSIRGGDLPGLELDHAVGPLQLRFAVAPPPADGRHDRPWRRIKEILRPALRNGWGAALARQLRDGDGAADPAAAPAALRLTWAGRLDRPVLGGEVVEVRWQPVAPGPAGRPALRAFVLGGALHLHWHHDPARLRTATVRGWAEELLDVLRAVIAAGRGEQEVELVPSDFPLAELDERSLGRVTDLLRRLEHPEGS